MAAHDADGCVHDDCCSSGLVTESVGQRELSVCQDIRCDDVTGHTRKEESAPAMRWSGGSVVFLHPLGCNIYFFS